MKRCPKTVIVLGTGHVNIKLRIETRVEYLLFGTSNGIIIIMYKH
jgi:hypothetical protein